VRRYFVDAVHPVWGLQVLNYRWLLQGKRFWVGVGGGRKRFNILGAWSPEDGDYVDHRGEENVNGQTVIDLMKSMHQRHPQTKKFLLYLDNARYFHAVLVRDWIQQFEQETGVKFVLEFLPPYSPNLNLIERLWKFLKQTALSTWHNTFAEMQAAVSSLLDHLDQHREALRTLLAENFQLWPNDVWELPAQTT
jgi:transposase